METTQPHLIASALLALTVVALWLRPWWWLAAFIVFLAVSLWLKLVAPVALIPVCLTGGLYFAFTRYANTTRVRLALLIVLSLLSVAFGVHAFPGFTAWDVVDTVKLSDSSAGYTMRYFLDKPLIGVFVLGLAYSGLARSWSHWRDMLHRLWKPLLAGLAIVYALSALLGYTRWDPTLSALFWPWAFKNLLFVCVAEEAFFRGFLQHQFAAMIPHRHAGIIALFITAMLFGIAHIAGGPTYVLLATVAGLVYGYAYYVTGRIEAAILTHFLLNAGHFLLFTYPYHVVA